MNDKWDEVERLITDLNNTYRAGMGLPPLKSHRRAPCDELVKPEDYEAHVEECEFCNAGGSVFDRYESEERRLDDPRHVPYSQQRKP